MALPITTWSTASGLTRESSRAALIAIAPSSFAERSFRSPNPGVPQYSAMAVRLPPRMKISCALISPALPVDLALFEECLEAGLRVLGPSRDPEQVRLELLRRGERHRHPAPHGVEDQ